MSQKSQNRQLRILLAEDNPHDQVLLAESFLMEGLPVEIDVVADGEVLMERLQDPLSLANYGLIVLDAHLPRRTAQEVLVSLHALDREVNTPIIVLTSMIPEAEKTRLFDYGVSQVLAKPLDLDEYIYLARYFYGILCGEPVAARKQSAACAS